MWEWVSRLIGLISVSDELYLNVLDTQLRWEICAHIYIFSAEYAQQ